MTLNTPHLLVTGGAGFVGSHFVDLALANGCTVTVVDKLTYAGNRDNLSHALETGRCRLVVADINQQVELERLLQEHCISHVVHCAAESHVDNSISGPVPFIHSNINGTFHVLEACRAHWARLSDTEKTMFRLLYVSTDEVYGALSASGAFNEASPLRPNSPYSASKAAADHLARAWHTTYGLPVVTTHCGNNYGSRQHAEKLIPTIIFSALSERTIPIYGDGKQVREWIHVKDHCQGLWLALTRGDAGGIYNFSGKQERENLALAQLICTLLDSKRPRQTGSYRDLIRHVADRPGHDRRYAINDSHARQALGFDNHIDLSQGLSETIEWYLARPEWPQHKYKELP